MKLGELCVFALLLGLSAGALYAVIDVEHHDVRLAPDDIIVAMVLGGVPAAIAALVLTIAAAVILLLFGIRPDRRTWTAVLIAVTGMGLLAALVLVGTHNHRDGTGLLVLSASFPIAGLAYAVIRKLTPLADPGRAVVWLLAALTAFVFAVCSVSAGRARGFHWVLGVLQVLVGVGVTSFAVYAGRRSVFRTGLGFTAALLVIAVLFSAFGRPGVGPLPAIHDRGATPPNVVLIVLDTTRRDHMGCYGHPGQLTPELDRLAADAVLYEDAISTSPWTAPSHASIFTGLYPMSHGCSYEHHLWLDDEFTTLAEMLEQRGYQTLALVSNVVLEQNNLLQGFAKVESYTGPEKWLSLRQISTGIGMPDKWTDKGGTEVRDGLERWISDGYDSTKPFYLFINLFDAHHPYLPPWRERAEQLDDEFGYFEASCFSQGFDNTLAHIKRTTDPYTRKLIGGMYEAGIRYQDRRLGEVLSLLRNHTDFDNTVVIVTADHGENLGDGGRWDHVFAVNDALMRVPLIVRFPKRLTPGTRVTGQCQTVDLVPTIFGLLDAEPPVDGLPGVDLIAEPFAARDNAFGQVSPHHFYLGLAEQTLGFDIGVMELNTHLRMLRTDKVKYIWSSNGRHMLYDLVNDPDETTNLIEAMPELAVTLDRQLADWWLSQTAYQRKAQSSSARPVDPGAIEHLKALGYIR
jgi:arylsulfatase A-like enzyme